MKPESNLKTNYKFLYDLPVALCLSDIDGNITFINKKFTELTGYSSQDISEFDMWIKRAFHKNDNPEDFKKQWLSNLYELFHGKTTKICNHCILTCKDKSQKKSQLTFSVFDNQFLVIYFSESYSDIKPGDDRKWEPSSSEYLNERFSNQGEDYYKQIVVDFANVAIVKFTKDLIVTDFAGNAETIFGFKKGDIIGKNLKDTIVPNMESTGRNLDHFLDDLAENTSEYTFNINENITKDGERIWMQWHNSELKDKSGCLTGILSIGINITSLINAEFALKESEERFKTLSDLTFEGILIHDNGIVLDCNLSFERQIGYSREELIGKNFIELLIPKEYRNIMLSRFRDNSSQYEAEAIHKDGSHIPISIEAKRTKIGDRYVRVAAIRNISDLKKTIAELDKYKNHLEEIVVQRTKELKHQSKELKKQNEILQFERNQLRTIMNNIPDLIYIKDVKHRFVNGNTRTIRHMGAKNKEEIIGKTDYDFYKKAYADKYAQDENSIIKTGMPVINKEEPSINEKGEKIYLLTSKIPLKDQKGKIKNIVGIGRDITEIKRAKDKVKEQAENLQKINIQLEERSHKIEKLNKELKESNKMLENANKILEERKAKLESTLEQLRSAQLHLVQSEKMASLGILMAGIAHEINNPVNFVYAGVNSIMKDFADIKNVFIKIDSLKQELNKADLVLDRIERIKQEYEFDLACDAIEETLQDVKLGAIRITEIVAGLSRFSRQATEEWKKTNIHEELDSVLVLLKNKYKHHIKIVKNYNKNLPLIDCYPGKLNQVFMNIINNAIDAIDTKGGKITIKTNTEKDSVKVYIEDTGRGISKDDKLKIFDPFFTTKDVGYGMGLGLAISYSIIQEHNGEIIVNSRIGKGTEFILKLPISQK